MALTAQQQLFVEEYLRTFNATDAYLTAYPSVKRNTAASNGHRLLKENIEIAELIQVRLSEAAMSADEVLMRLAQEARAEYAEYIITTPCLDLIRMAKDGKADLIPQVIDHRGNIDVLALALNGKLAQVAEYIIEPGYVDIAAMERDGKKHLIKAIRPTQWGKAVEFYDAQAAKTNLGKYHKLFVDRQEIENTGKVTINVVYDDADSKTT